MKMLKKDFEHQRSVMDLSKVHYLDAVEWMWDYCLYLGSFTNSKGQNFDLGIHRGSDSVLSAAIVRSNEPGDYSSGRLDLTSFRTDVDGTLITVREDYNWREDYVELIKICDNKPYIIQ